jgi:hypothetical protein
MSLVGFGIIKPFINMADTAITLTASQSGSVLVITADNTGARAVTLPQVQAGLNFRIINRFGALTNAWTVTTAAADAIMRGQTSQANTVAVLNAAARTTITIVAANTKVGDFLDINCDGTNWLIYGSTITAATFTFA